MPIKTEQTKRNVRKKDWALLVIDAAKQNTMSPIQLQKALFLLGQNIPKDVGPDFYKFIPHNFGPFAQDIYDDVADLCIHGLIEEINKPGQSWPEYRISQAGRGEAEKIRAALAPKAKEYLDTLVPWVERQSFQDLLHSVYKAYPAFAEKSVFNR